MCSLAKNAARTIGYPAGDCVARQARQPSRRSNVVDGPEKIPICLPYIYDAMGTVLTSQNSLIPPKPIIATSAMDNPQAKNQRIEPGESPTRTVIGVRQVFAEMRQNFKTTHLFANILLFDEIISINIDNLLPTSHKITDSFGVELRRIGGEESPKPVESAASVEQLSADVQAFLAVAVAQCMWEPLTVLFHHSDRSQSIAHVLDLGPSFAPSQSIRSVISRKIVGSLQLVHERLRLRAKEEEQDRVQETSRVRVFPPIPFPTLLYKPQEANSVVDTKFRLFATSVFSILSRYSHKRAFENLTPTQRKGLCELRDICAEGKIKISVSDKGGEFVVISSELDRAITKLHLTDDSLYHPSSAHEFGRQYRRLNRIWIETAKSVGLPKTTITRLKCDRPTCPVLYVLIKTHKLSAAEFSSNNPGDFKVRPIISNIGGPTDRISWFLNTILSQLLQYVPAHLSNTKMFIEHLRKARLDGDCVIESFDVTSLYTNVSIDAALQATSELLLEHQGTLNMYGFAIQQIMMLLSECLRCSVFRWSGQYYRQIRGLAMGQRLAPTLAVAFMSKVEKPLLERKPLLYCRYIDDCCIVQCHDNTPFKIAVTILARESDVLARKTLEAFYITAKSPIMNRKEECIAVTNELAPYQDLCGF
ncbi:hypothetical protein RB195_020029 [Necator americanus]|uniref:Reverse transcriptase domain-containing protein n=1 Tax=Necator americanus TaxID=51031 RepID=A0ABR1CJP1_NECAM